MPIIDVNELPDYDPTRDYLSKEEYNSLSTVERNQLALDRYKASHKNQNGKLVVIMNCILDIDIHSQDTLLIISVHIWD